MGVLEKMGRDFLQGYRNGQQQAENEPKMMIFRCFSGVAIRRPLLYPKVDKYSSV